MGDVGGGTDGLVVSSGGKSLPELGGLPVNPRYDVVCVLDDRGWVYRYSHLQSIHQGVTPGNKVSLGQRIGILGKEGGSGGWSHLHFDIKAMQPSGLWGTQAAYAMVWQASLKEHAPEVLAVARPHHLIRTGDTVVLDGSKSWCAAGGQPEFDWTFTDGSKASGARVERRYDQAGYYSEILKVEDARGHVDYDFQVVQVIDREKPGSPAVAMHAAFAPTVGIKPGDIVTFKVRSYGIAAGETWDFGDGSAPVTVRSDGNRKSLAKDGYAVTTHKFAAPGDYLVAVRHNTHPSVARLHVVVESGAAQ